MENQVTHEKMDWDGIQAHLRSVNSKNNPIGKLIYKQLLSILTTITKIQLNLLFIEEAVIVCGPGP